MFLKPETAQREVFDNILNPKIYVFQHPVRVSKSKDKQLYKRFYKYLYICI